MQTTTWTVVVVVGADTRQFQTSPASQSVFVDSTVTLDCLTGYSAPPADVRWLHDAVTVTTGRRTVAEFGSRQDGGTSARRSASLTLDFVSLADGGFYKCVAVNPLSGEVVHSRRAYVNVTGKLQHSSEIDTRTYIPASVPPIDAITRVHLASLCIAANH